MIELLVILYFAMPILLHTPVAFIIIRSDSMLPILEKGDLAVISGLDKKPSSLVNETIAFYDPTQGKIIVHRAIERNGDCLITKGDNADNIDFFQPTKKFILGKVLFKTRH